MNNMNNFVTRVGGGAAAAAADDEQKPKFAIDTVESFIFFEDRFKRCEVAHVQHAEYNYNYVKHQCYYPNREIGGWKASSYSLMPLKAWSDYVAHLESLNNYLVQLAKTEGKFLRKFKLVYEDDEVPKCPVAPKVPSLLDISCSSSSESSMHKTISLYS